MRKQFQNCFNISFIYFEFLIYFPFFSFHSIAVYSFLSNSISSLKIKKAAEILPAAWNNGLLTSTPFGSLFRGGFFLRKVGKQRLFLWLLLWMKGVNAVFLHQGVGKKALNKQHRRRAEEQQDWRRPGQKQEQGRRHQGGKE